MYTEKEISFVRGYGRVFTVIREGWRADGRTRGEVKGGIVGAEAKGGEKGWRGNAAGVHTQRN